MRLNDEVEPDEKQKLLLNARAGNDLCLRLFYQARNMAIELASQHIKDYLEQKGLQTTVTWKEDSRSAAIQLVLTDKERHERHVTLKRDVIGNTEAMSRCFYSLNQVQRGEYYRYRKPKIAVIFDEVLGSPEFTKFVSGRINDANYPFPYTSHSSV